MMMIMSQCEIVSGKDETKMKSPLLYRISYKSSHSQIYCISLRQHPKYTKYRLFVLVVVCCLLFVSMEGGNQQLSCGVRKVNEAWLVIDGFLPSGNFIKARSPLQSNGTSCASTPLHLRLHWAPLYTHTWHFALKFMILHITIDYGNKHYACGSKAPIMAFICSNNRKGSKLTEIVQKNENCLIGPKWRIQP